MNNEKLNTVLQPIQPLLDDAAVVEIMIDGADRFLVERNGELEEVTSPFADGDSLTQFAQQLTTLFGRPASADMPMVDGRLPDGSRVNVVMPPVSLMDGPAITIRKLTPQGFTWDDLIGFGSLNQSMLDFLSACIRARLNMVISGGTGSGKTTVLNMLGEFIPPQDRVIVVEHPAEIQLRHGRIVRLEGRQPDADGRGGVSPRDLVINALKMRPDRLILGEARGPEVVDLFAGMTTGHDGSMLSIHAQNPRDVLSRLETMATMSDLSLPLLTIRQQITSALNIISHQDRLADGSRKITRISEVVGMQGDGIELQDIYVFRQTGVKDGRIQGQFVPTGYIPKCLRRLHDAGQDIPITMFTPQ